MASLKKITAPVLLAFFMLGAADRANATFPSVDLVAGNSVTYDGLQFSVASCSYTSNGAVQTSCSAANDVLEVVASNRGTPTIEITGVTTGTTTSAALSCSSCSAASSLVTTLNVTQASGSASTITAFSNAITAVTADSGITSRATYNGAGGGTSTENAATLLSSGAIAVTNALTSSTASMSFTVTLGLAANSGGVLALSTDSLHFSPAPEPATIAVFGAGLVGLTAVRRRLKRGTARQVGSTSIAA